MSSQSAKDNMDPWARKLAECAGLLMPDGSTRPRPSWMDKPQGQWTEEESKQCAALQQEHIEMTKRLRNLNGEGL